MKLNGFVGKGSGKLGSSVFAISGGEQIVRQYNPVVSNPNTEAQIEQRAKFKLLSQLAADMASVIVIPKSGNVSARNQFVSKNFGAVEFEEGTASCDLFEVQITNGSSALASGIDISGENLQLASAAAAQVSRVVYCVFNRDSDERLSLVSSYIVEEAGAGRTFPLSGVQLTAGQIVFAYGMADKNGSASAKYADYEVNDAIGLASLIASRSLSASDYTFTKTLVESASL